MSLDSKPVELATVKDGNNYILSWIAISPEDLKAISLSARNTTNRSLKAPIQINWLLSAGLSITTFWMEQKTSFKRTGHFIFSKTCYSK